MNISTASREALHALLDISLDTQKEIARVVARYSPEYERFAVDIYLPENTSSTPDENWWLLPIAAECALREVRAYLSPENLAAVAAQKRAARVTALEQQLADARKEIA